MKPKTGFAKVISIILMVFALFFACGGLMNLLDKSKNEKIEKWLVAFIFLAIIPFFAGLYIYIKTKKKINKFKVDQLENQILRLAKANKRRLTISDVAVNTALSPEESKSFLDDLCIKGLAEIQVSESGVIIYFFKSIIADEEKEKAEGF